MFKVMRTTPGLAITDVIPFERCAIQMRIIHKVVCAMHDVVTDFHVIEDLGNAKHHGTHNKPDPVVKTGNHHRTPTDIQHALHPNNVTDVASVFFTHFGHRLVTNLIEVVFK